MKSLSAAALLLVCLVSSCGKEKIGKEADLSLEASEVGVSTATVVVNNAGDNPAVCRLVTAEIARELEKLLPDLDDLDAVGEYARENGLIINPPYTAYARYLIANEDYTAFAVCYGKNGRAQSVSSVSFHTLMPDNTIGDNDLAGVLWHEVYGAPISGQYPNKWHSTDQLGIFSYDRKSTENDNVWIRILSSSEGLENGSFYAVENDLVYPIFEDEKFLVYFPYRKDVTFEHSDAGNTLHSVIPAEQSIPETNAPGLGESGFAFAIADVAADDNPRINFTMNHLCSYLQFVVSSSELASRQLKSIKLIDLSGRCQIAGKVTVNLSEASMALDGEGSSCITTGVASSIFSGNESEQTICMAAIPGDYASGEWCILLNYAGEGNSVISIPIKLSDYIDGPFILDPGTLYTIRMENISESSSSISWYEPSEPRDLLGKWAYGAQNTYYVESKAGEENLFSFEVRGRGDITKLREPKYYGLLVPAEDVKRTLLEMPDGVKVHESNPTRPVGDDYTISVKVQSDTARGSWGTVAIYDEDYNILWSFMICKYHSGDPVGSVLYSDYGFELMDRIIGQPYSNSKSAVLGMMNPERAQGGSSESYSWAYFQWGRKDPMAWNQLPGYSKRVAVATDDVPYTIAHPQVFLARNASAVNTRGNWMVEQDNTLWGNENTRYANNLPTKLKGHKTIYDPCPEGYRTPDPAVLLALYLKGERMEIANGHKNQDPIYISDDNPFSDCSVLAYPLSDGEYDYWPYAGNHWCSSDSWGNRVSSQFRHSARYAANSNAGNAIPAYKVGGYMLTYLSSSLSIGDNATEKATTISVRCQKED